MNKMKRVIWLVMAALFIVLILPSSNASAHRPMWGDTLRPVEIDSISTSYAFYQELKANKVDVFYFDGKQGDNFHAGIQIPDIAALQDYGVSIALFGQGLPKPEESQLPADHPKNLGAIIAPNKIGEDFFEPFTQANYWGRQVINTTLPADGTYYILVWHPEGTAGKYVMDTGYAEEFGLLDFFAYPIWWVRVQVYQQYYARLVVFFSIIILTIGFFIYRRFRAAQK